MVFFVLGISLMELGVVFLTISPAYISFMGAGAVFMAFDLSNRDKWTQSKKVA